jgi:hypothetical protein
MIAILLALLWCLCMPPSLAAEKLCPLGDAGGVPNASCNEGTTCAIFDGRQAKCTGWSNYRCAAREFRNLKTCECVACPAGSGLNCDRDNECCSLGDCGEPTTSTPKARPLGLSSTSRLHPHAATNVLVCVVLSFIGGT